VGNTGKVCQNAEKGNKKLKPERRKKAPVHPAIYEKLSTEMLKFVDEEVTQREVQECKKS